MTGALVVAAWACAAALFSLLAWARLWRRSSLFARTSRAGRGRPASLRVLLLRPLDAPTPRELENLHVPLRLPEGVEVEQVVLSPYRPRLPDGVRWLYSDPVSPNRKVGHLLYGLHALALEGDLEERVVLCVDADVSVDGALVEALALPLLEGAALTTATPAPQGEGGLGSWAVQALLRRTHHSFRALDAMSAGAKAVCGKALGLGSVAQRLLPEMAGHIGEDLELSSRLHALGARVELARVPARVPLSPTLGLDEAVDRFTRWMQVLRAHRPALYPTVPLLFAPTPLLVALTLLGGVGLVLGPSAQAANFTQAATAAGALVALVLARTALAWALDRRLSLDWLLGETLLLAAFLRSLMLREVSWRGRRFELAPGGRMAPR